MTTVEMAVTGMHCESCAALIQEVLAEQPGVLASEVDLERARASLTFDEGATNLGALQSAITELGYGSTPLDRGSSPPTS
jgi:copper chaperone CopZ